MNMHVLMIILFLFSRQNEGLDQDTNLVFAKDVRIVVDNQVQKRLAGATVKFITREKTYVAKYVELNQNYRFDSLPMIKGTFKVSHPGYEYQARKAIPIDGGWSTNDPYPFQFTLGKAGNAYTIHDNRLYPYTAKPFAWAISYWRNDLDTIIDYLHQNGFVVVTHYEEVRALIVYPNMDSIHQASIKINTQSRAKQYETLVSFEPIRILGPLGSHERYGDIFLSNILSIKFISYTKPEEKQLIYDKYNLEFYELGPALTHYVKVMKNGHQINKISIELMKEPIIAHVNTQLGSFKMDPSD